MAKPSSAACFGVKPRHCLLTASKAVSRCCGWHRGGNSCGVPLIFGVSALLLAPCLLSVLFPCVPRDPVNWEGAGAAHALQLVMLFLWCRVPVGLMGSKTALVLPVPQQLWPPESPLLEELTLLWCSLVPLHHQPRLNPWLPDVAGSLAGQGCLPACLVRWPAWTSLCCTWHPCLLPRRNSRVRVEKQRQGKSCVKQLLRGDPRNTVLESAGGDRVVTRAASRQEGWPQKPSSRCLA